MEMAARRQALRLGARALEQRLNADTSDHAGPERLAGVQVSVSQVEGATEALGAEIADDECSCVERIGAVARTMYLGMDGTGVPMRKSVDCGIAG